MVILGLTGYLLLYLLAQAGFVWLLARPLLTPAAQVSDDGGGGRNDTPPITVLVAARNEQANLPRCLAALAALDYPPDCLSVLLADDASTDATPQLLREFVRERPGWRVLTITEALGQARGKANALEHLIRAADTELLICCDADVAVPPQWARALVAEAQRTNAALVVGTTLIAGPGWHARMQALEWLRALATLQVTSLLGRPFTAMGNNQLLRKSAYEATGGYARLPFSVTEDYQLFRVITRQGGRTTHLLEPGVLAWSQPPESIGVLLRQRHRWLRGLNQLAPGNLRLLLALEALVTPALVVLAICGRPGWAGLLWGGRLLLRAALLRVASRRLALPGPTLLEVLTFEGYLLLSAAAMTLLAIWPGKVTWKGRKL